MASKQARPVLDGKTLKWTLERQQHDGTSKVRVDWLRFALPFDFVVGSEFAPFPDLAVFDCLDKQGRELIQLSRSSDAKQIEGGPGIMSRTGAQMVAQVLSGLAVGVTEERGMDYYSARTALVIEGETVGWVLAGGKAANQASTVHVNLFGSALLRVSRAKLSELRAFIDKARGWITRCDLALDIFEGLAIEEVRAAYLRGAFDVYGKRPGQHEAGSWTSGHSRTFYVGARASGKYFRAYEKGHEQFGHESGDPWVRLEVEFRNNQRVIDTAVLTECGEFFAGAYPYCWSMLAKHGTATMPQVIACTKRLADKTAEGAVHRVVRWLMNTAGPAIARALVDGGDVLGVIVDRQQHKTPRRLAGFSLGEVRQAFEKVAGALAPAPAPFAIGAA